MMPLASGLLSVYRNILQMQIGFVVIHTVIPKFLGPFSPVFV